MKACRFIILVSLALLPNHVYAVCNLCLHGGSITSPNKTLSIPGFSFVTSCRTLQPLLAIIQENSTECSLLKSIGPLCGCHPAEDPCTFCSDATTTIENPDLPLPFLAPMFNGLVPTCELVESHLLGLPQTHEMCTASRELLAGPCGCPQDDYDNQAEPCTTCPMGEPIPQPLSNISIPGLSSFETCGQLNAVVTGAIKQGQYACDLVQKTSPSLCACVGPKKPCTLCRDGSGVPPLFQNKSIPFARQASLGSVPTCESFEAYVSGVEADSEDCKQLQVMGSYCGCPALENHCTYCVTHDFAPELKDFDPGFIEIDPKLRIEPTCELFETTQYQVHKYSDECLLGTFAAHICGCRGGEAVPIFGAHNELRKSIMRWIPRAAAFLTLVGTTAIQIDVVGSPIRRRRVYNRLILFMSVFDAMLAISFGLLGSLVIPKTTLHGNYDTGIDQSFGTKSTCIAQGWFSSFGLTSIFSSIVLALYYKLTILDGWRESRLKKQQWWMFGVPLLLGLISAAVSIPYIEVSPLGCFISTIRSAYKVSITFISIPSLGGVVALVSTIIYIYCELRRRDKKAQKWRLDGRYSDNSNNNNGSTYLYSRGSIQSSSASQSLSTGMVPKPPVDSVEQPSAVVRVDNFSTQQHSRQKQKKYVRSKIVKEAYWQAVAYVGSYCFTWLTLVVGFLLSHYISFSCYPFWVIYAFCVPINGFNNSLIYFRPRIAVWWEKLQCHPCGRDGDKDDTHRQRESQGREETEFDRAAFSSTQHGDANRDSIQNDSEEITNLSQNQVDYDPSVYISLDQS